MRDKILAKVPLWSLSCLLSEVLIDLLGISANHITFAKDWEFDAVGTNDKLLDNRLCLWLFISKLVAWESQDLQASLSVLLVQLYIVFVVVSVASNACHVDHNGHLGSVSQLANLLLLLLTDQSRGEVKDLTHLNARSIFYKSMNQSNF